jgi:hypothetical protein
MCIAASAPFIVKGEVRCLLTLSLPELARLLVQTFGLVCKLYLAGAQFVSLRYAMLSVRSMMVHTSVSCAAPGYEQTVCTLAFAQQAAQQGYALDDVEHRYWLQAALAQLIPCVIGPIGTCKIWVLGA